MNQFSKALKLILQSYFSTFDERGELPASYRENIYRNIERFSSDRNNSSHYLRARLELYCALKVVKHLEACNSIYDSATELLAMCKQESRVRELKELEQRKNYFYTQVENLLDNGKEYFVPAYAGFACISAVNAVLYDLNPDALKFPEIESDPDDWTACFYASTSYCGGATWEEGVGDDLKRREFWVWFLKDAVPALWVI